MTDLCALSAIELGRLYRTRDLSPVEVIDAILRSIRARNPGLNAYISVQEEAARAAARLAEAQFRDRVELGALQGVPFSVKDIIRVRGTVTTAASLLLHDASPDTEDAACVLRLRRQGAICIGKTNLHEFAFGAPAPGSRFGLVQNPRRLGHQAGGSSSGSGAAVAAGLGVLSLGTDTGGSVRFPATLCGLVGLKPTRGLVSTHGVLPLNSRFDEVGPLGRCVADVAACLSAISEPAPARKPIDQLRVGIPYTHLFPVPERAAKALDFARDALAAAGASVVPVELPLLEAVRENWEVVACVELWEHHRAGLAEGAPYGDHFRRRAEFGAGIPAVRYAHALAILEKVRTAWLRLFMNVDIVLLSGNLVGAPAHGVETVNIGDQALPVVAACSPYNRIASVTGFPAVVIPAGEDETGMPLGVQLIGPPGSDSLLLQAGEAIEKAGGDPVARWGIDAPAADRPA